MFRERRKIFLKLLVCIVLSNTTCCFLLPKCDMKHLKLKMYEWA